mgnify:FL=1
MDFKIRENDYNRAEANPVIIKDLFPAEYLEYADNYISSDIAPSYVNSMNPGEIIKIRKLEYGKPRIYGIWIKSKTKC